MGDYLNNTARLGELSWVFLQNDSFAIASNLKSLSSYR